MTSNNAFAARTCIVGVVVTNKSNMASHLPEAENLIGSNADMCSDVTGLSSSGSGDLFELSDRSNIYMHYNPPFWIWVDHNSHTAFRDVLHHFAYGLSWSPVALILIKDPLSPRRLCSPCTIISSASKCELNHLLYLHSWSFTVGIKLPSIARWFWTW